MNTITTAQCPECGGAIEYDGSFWCEGAAADCPHCGKTTTLPKPVIYAPPHHLPQNRSQAAALPAPPVARPPRGWRPLGMGSEVVLHLGGFLLMAAAGVDSLMGITNLPVLAQIIIGCTGVLTICAGTIVAFLRNIAEKPRE